MVLTHSNQNVYKDGSLEIIQSAESDTGFYKCVARFRSLTFESRQAYVKVVNRSLASSSPSSSLITTKPNFVTLGFDSIKSAPRFYLTPEDRNVQVDDEVIFDCLAQNDASTHVSAGDLNTVNAGLAIQYFKYKWLKDGIAIDLK